ncbi:MAG: radical SAM protein [Pseudomonadota bacterium]
MAPEIEIREIQCKSAIGKCGFPGGGWAINPYVGCSHGCVYCYARFMKKFTGHTEKWGTFVDVRTNIAEVVRREAKSPKLGGERIYIGTVTDPYQPVEEKYELTRNILMALRDYKNPVSILTKSDLVVRDVDLLKQLKGVDVNFTVNTLDEEWKRLVEPYSPSLRDRFQTMKRLVDEGIAVEAMLGPYWPFFTDPEVLFERFKAVGVSQVFTESVNPIGGNWTGVEQVLKKNYPQLLFTMRNALFNRNNFYEFYEEAEKKIQLLSEQFQIPVTISFGMGHAAKLSGN